MTFTVQIGSGRALFTLPGGRFDQITRDPLRIAEASAWAPVTQPIEKKEAVNK